MVICTLLVIAMSVWGIIKVEQDARDVVPESFDFMEQTEHQLDSIHSTLRAAVENGNRIVVAVRAAAEEIQRDQTAQALREADGGFNQTIDDVLQTMVEESDSAESALRTVDEEINEVDLFDLIQLIRISSCRTWMTFWTD